MRITMHIRQNIDEMSWQFGAKLRTKVVTMLQMVFLIYQKISRNPQKPKALQIKPKVRYY
jgi:hypothetical protein